jgi:hypothetical protein
MKTFTLKTIIEENIQYKKYYPKKTLEILECKENVAPK